MVKALVAWLALAGSPPEAAPPDVWPLSEAIVVPAGDACLARGLEQPVATWLGRDVIERSLSVEVRVVDDGVGFVLRRAGEIRVERMLSPAPLDCADRRAALGLAIAMALDAAVLEALAPPVEATPPEPQPEPTPPPPVETEVPVPPPPASEPVPPGPVPPRVQLAVTAEPAVQLGALPRVAFGGELGAELGLGGWLDLRLAGGGTAGLPIALADGQVDGAIGWGAAEGCPARALGRVRVRLCVGAAAGGLWVRGRGFDQSRSVTLPWVAVRTGADLDVRLARRVSLRVGGRLLTPLVRGRISVRDPSDALVDRRELAPAGAQLGLGVVLHLRERPPGPDG